MLAVLGLIFVAVRLGGYRQEIEFDRLGWVGLTATGGLVLLYGLAGIMLALAWWHLLRHFGGPTSRRWAVSAYGLSQISKYLPGNIFHLAARQARGMAAGVRAWPLAKSAAWELGLLAACGALFGFLVMPLLVPDTPIWLSTAVFLGGFGAGTLLLTRLVGPPVGSAFAWQGAFLLSSALLFLAILALLGGLTAANWGDWPVLLGAYIIAWLAGLLTPGSPAGLGVREMVLLLLLADLVPEAVLLEGVVLARIVSVLGDAAFFVAALLLSKTRAAWAESAANQAPSGQTNQRL